MSDVSSNDVTHLSSDPNRPLSEQVLLAFAGETSHPLVGPWAKAKQDQQLQITFEDATRGIIVLGSTGFGKTVTAIEPAIKQLIDNGCGGMILTTKNADLGILDDFPEKIVILGGSDLATPTNLIAGVPSNVIRVFLEETRHNVERNGSYWGSRGVIYAIFVLETRRLMGRNPTLACLYDALSAPADFVADFDPWIESQEELPQEYLRLLNDVLNDRFSILSRGRSSLTTNNPESDEENERLREQYTWQTNQVITPLQKFGTDSRLRKYLCDPKAPPVDMSKVLYEDRKVIMTDLPETVFAGVGRIVNGILRSQMRNAVLSYPRHRKEGYGRDRFTFMVIDEFQHHISLDSSAAAKGLFDDNTWFDRSREFGQINIVATQGISSLAAKVPSHEPNSSVHALLQNIGTTITFASHDVATIEYMGRHVGGTDAQAVQQIISGHLDIGQALCASHRLRNHGGSMVAHVRGGAVAGFPHMTYGLGRGERVLDEDRFRPLEPQYSVNPFVSNTRTIKGWTDWLGKNRKLVKGQMVKAMTPTPANIPRRSYSVTNDKLGRSLAFSRQRDSEIQLHLDIKREHRDGAWRLSISIDALKSLSDELPQRRGFVDLFHREDSAKHSLEETDGWRIRLTRKGQVDHTFTLAREEESVELVLPSSDWEWLCEIAELLFPVYLEARENAFIASHAENDQLLKHFPTDDP
ncbi:abortive infection family protein [Aquisalimonas sp. 2447]|uniref:abortive infection family protein n=1 Tax=Aquisalimonas sp. 2447 TaxID=2740807 RepID=UPI0014323AEB|nr:abortive infection family protein [Aquisalimonas sp. 2447]QIT55037.1 abortive infection family protein [Aquisalimonas sp. 2447]